MKKRFVKGPVVLVILDGWGEWDNVIGNPVKLAKLPTFDMLDKHYPKLLLDASGPSVGLPWGVYGNSEVGHQTIGSGQIIFQYLPVIDTAIQTGEIEHKPALFNSIERLKENDGALHLWGICSDGGVHSHINHLLIILDIAKKNNLKKVYIHFIADGRDTSQKVALKFVKQIQNKLAEIGIGKIASICGRYFAMDRNNNWDRIEKAYLAMAKGRGIMANDPIGAINDQYANGGSDEYLEPISIIEQGMPVGIINDKDLVFCFNYRKDRSRQMTKAFISDDFDNFIIDKRPQIDYLCMTEYEEGLSDNVIFSSQKITTRVGEILSKNNLKQLRTAETEKFAHVTYFFNGGLSAPFPGEDRIIVPSKNCKSYAEMPEMSAFEVTEKLMEALGKEKYDFILVNYANSDMVGHTGVLKAGIKACEAVDECLNKLINVVLKKDGCLLITADHGNIEEMIKIETGKVDTEHSVNPVPCWFVFSGNKNTEPLIPKGFRLNKSIIADLAPTILELFGIKTPHEMSGKSLLGFLTGKKTRFNQDQHE